MGSDTPVGNEDIKIKGNINVYIFGKINNQTNCDENDATINYKIINQLFPNRDINKNSFIFINNDINNKYMYEYRINKKLKNDKRFEGKSYNAFLFFNDDDKNLSHNLVNHLKDKDVDNENKNVIIYFGEEHYIIDSITELSKESPESVPFLIVVNNICNYDEKLKYINYIPNFHSIQKLLGNENYDENVFREICYETLYTYILTKLFRIDMYYNQLGYNLNLINPFNETYSKIKFHLTIALAGYSGCGKSTLVNLVFKELVSRVSPKVTEVTTLCSEYYLPVGNIESKDIGQIRFLIGITENENYLNVVKPKIEEKMEEYKKNLEQINVVLFFITNGNNRELTKSGLDLIKLFHRHKIKIIFIINGTIKPQILEAKKIKLKNALKNLIKNEVILNDDFSNFINTDYYQFYNDIDRTGISTIFEKIIDIVKIKDENFQVEDITINNYNDKLALLRKSSIIFEMYENMKIIKEEAKTKAIIAVVGYSLLTCGTSALSIVIPFVDAAAAIGYQVAMVYNIFYIYELNTDDYKIKDIILSGGNTIELENDDKKQEKEKDEKKGEEEKEEKDEKKGEEKKNDEVKDGNIREAIGDVAKGAVFAGQIGIGCAASKEAGKMIIEKSVETIVKETVETTTIKASLFSLETTLVKTAELSVTNTVERIVVESSKELIEEGIKQTSTQIALESSKIGLGISQEGFGVALTYGSKESIQQVTETIVIQQGGKSWLINLGKAVPFIGAGISAFMNTFSTGKIGYKLVKKLDEEFENNQERQVNMLKGKCYCLLNVIEQMKNI